MKRYRPSWNEMTRGQKAALVIICAAAVVCALLGYRFL